MEFSRETGSLHSVSEKSVNSSLFGFCSFPTWVQQLLLISLSVLAEITNRLDPSFFRFNFFAYLRRLSLGPSGPLAFTQKRTKLDGSGSEVKANHGTRGASSHSFPLRNDAARNPNLLPPSFHCLTRSIRIHSGSI